MEKEIIVLAKSSKHGEFCIAGIDTSTGEWVRPVSNNPLYEGSVPHDDIRYADGTELQVLDKVKIKFLSHSPSRSQPENYLYDSRCPWEKTDISTIQEVIDSRGYDDNDIIFYNLNHIVTEDEIIEGQPSLLLVRVNRPYIFIKTFERKKIKLNFEYNNDNYKYFSISDPVVNREHLYNHDGKYNKGEYLDVVFSLTGKHIDGKYYKMVAQIFD